MGKAPEIKKFKSNDQGYERDQDYWLYAAMSPVYKIYLHTERCRTPPARTKK